MFDVTDYMILVVDDEPGILQMLAEDLSEEGYATITAETGVEALRLIRSNRPDIVLLDAMLPGLIDGFGVLAALHYGTEASSIPVMLVTAVADLERVKTAIELGVVGYIVKPFKLRDVRARVQKVLSGRPPNHSRPVGVAERSEATST